MDPRLPSTYTHIRGGSRSSAKMAASTAPSTPEHNIHATPRRIAMNRSVTVPPELSFAQNTTPEIGAADGIETLYTHPTASVIKFSTSGPASRPSSSSGSPRPRAGEESAGKLPWASPTERTLASGPLEIYRVPGSVSFLHSGSLLHAILPRSQCWCVDGVSKFAFRVLPDTYYRIELPGETPEDLEAVERLKVTLQKVLFYERTPCPFARTFNVELPLEDAVQVKKTRRKSSGPAKRWRLDRAYSWKPEDGGVPPAERRVSDESEGSGSGSGTATSSDDEAARAGASQSRQVEVAETAEQVAHLSVQTPSRPPRGLAAMRSITAPPQLTLQSTPPSRLRAGVGSDNMQGASDQPDEAQAHGGAEAQDPTRLRTFQAIPTDMPPSPPDSSAGLDFREQHSPVRSASSAVEEEVPTAQPEVERSDQSEDVSDEVSDVHSSLATKDVPLQDSRPVEQASLPHLLPQSNRALWPSEPRAANRANDSETSRSRTTVRCADIEPALSSPAKVEAEIAATAPLARIESAPEDPFAAIQARILARRSICGTTSFHPATSPTRSSTSSSSSTATVRSTVSIRSKSQSRQQQAFATALVRKACAVFLGPPAHLVTLMLRIAARFAMERLAAHSTSSLRRERLSEYLAASSWKTVYLTMWRMQKTSIRSGRKMTSWCHCAVRYG